MKPPKSPESSPEIAALAARVQQLERRWGRCAKGAAAIFGLSVLALAGWAPLEGPLESSTGDAAPPHTAADALEIVADAEGDRPYVPSRLEWASLLANATLGEDARETKGYAVRFLPGRRGSDTVHVRLAYDPRKSDRRAVAAKVNYYREALHALAATKGWQEWFQVAVDVQVEHSAEADEAEHGGHISRGLRQLAEGEAEAAIAEFNQAIALRPDIYSGYINRGNVHHQRGDWNAALGDFNTARRLAPQQHMPWNNIAWIRATCPEAQHRDGEEAVELARKACELTQWKDFATLSTLAAAHAEAGDFEAAVARQKECLELAPEALRPALAEAMELYQAQQPLRAGQ